MPELVRSFATRLREFVGNRRRAPRYPARLNLSVSLRETKSPTSSHSGELTIKGYTRNLSRTGVAIIVPVVRIGNRYLTATNHLLQLKIELPTGPIQIDVKPVRHEQLEDDESETGYLVGAQIVTISNEDEQHLTEYLQMLATKRA